MDGILRLTEFGELPQQPPRQHSDIYIDLNLTNKFLFYIIFKHRVCALRETRNLTFTFPFPHLG